MSLQGLSSSRVSRSNRISMRLCTLSWLVFVARFKALTLLGHPKSVKRKLGGIRLVFRMALGG
jgi:hypothetical protein